MQSKWTSTSGHPQLFTSVRLFVFLALAVGLTPGVPSMSIIALTTVRYVSASGDCGGVAPCYSTIQAALDAAEPGDTIKVSQGTYTSNASAIASITKAVTLSGGYSNQ